MSNFNEWSTLSDFFFTSSGPVDGDDWAISNSTDGGTPVWVDTETPASSYTPGAAGNYTIVLTTQDWVGDQQPLITIATDNDIVDPFGSNANSIGNLAAVAYFSNTSTTASEAVLYWQASTTSGDYALEFEPITTTFPASPTAGPSTVVSGSAVTMDAAIADPTGWSFNSANATSLVLAYTTAVNSTTEDLWFQGFSNSGAATTAPVEVLTDVSDSTQYYIAHGSEGYAYRYTVVDGSATGLYGGTFNDDTGALGAADEILSLPSFTRFTGVGSRSSLSDGSSLRFLEGVEGDQPVLQAYLNSDATPTASFDLTSASDRFSFTDVYDPGDNQLDYTVVAYADNNQVHLELLNASGNQIGSDFIVPGLTSFDRLHTLNGNVNGASTRVEIDYTAANPNGGTEIEGIIYDTATAPFVYTLSGGGEEDGTPFDDTITYGPGVYFVDGGGGTDTFVATNFTPSEVSVTVNAQGNVVLSDGNGDADTLRRFSTIELSGATIAISGDTLRQTNADGSKVVSTFNITGQIYTETVYNYNPSGILQYISFDGVSGKGYTSYQTAYDDGVYLGTTFDYPASNQPYSSYDYVYSAGGDYIGSKFFYPGGQAYKGEEVDYDGGGNVSRIAFTGVTGVAYSSYEYDYVGGVFAGSEFTVTSVPAGATYSSYALDYNAASAFIGDKFYFTDLSGQSYKDEEEDFNASAQLSRVLLTGVTGQSYSTLEEDYSAGIYTGYKAYYRVTGQSFSNEEVDVNASNAITKVVYSGLSGPYSSVEQDYSNGALQDVVYSFTNVSGASAYAYQVTDNASGAGLQETFDNSDGTHRIIGLANNQTLTSIGNDTITGGGSGATFLLNAVYGHDTITDFSTFATGASHDTISLPSVEFANFAAVEAAATNSGTGVLIRAADGDTLTLQGLNTTTLAGLGADFTFHS